MITNISAGFFENIATIFTSESFMGMLFNGFLTTILVSVCAAFLGLVLGTVVALIKLQPDTKAWTVPKAICGIYTTVIRGTPMALQLFIMAFAIFAIRGFPMVITAIIAFGINSGAYVSENIRAGILSVDKGQTEASRALGVGTGKTLLRIVIPQGMKNVIPAIGNELVALVKETSIVTLIGDVHDLTWAASIIGSGQHLANYAAPMVVAALFYLLLVYALTLCIKLIERRLRKSEKR